MQNVLKFKSRREISCNIFRFSDIFLQIEAN